MGAAAVNSDPIAVNDVLECPREGGQLSGEA